MQSEYSESDRNRAIQTLLSIEETIIQLTEWNKDIKSTCDYYESQRGMQLLAANCTLITAIGEGVNRVNRILPGFLSESFPNVPWQLIIGMRNQIAHGYFELDGDVVFETIREDMSPLLDNIRQAISYLE